MHTLSGLDALYLSLEISEQPMQIIALGLLRAGTGGTISLADLRRHLAARLDQLPALRCRVVAVPLGLAHPVLVEDLRFDLGDHLCHMVLPAPGTSEQLDTACARLASQPLDRGRPLWRITLIIDGLSDGRQATVLEVHHALMDGFAIRTTLVRIFSAEEPAAGPAPWQPGRMPGPLSLIAGGAAQGARALARLPELVGRTRRTSVAVRQRRAAAAVTAPTAGVDTPPSAINRGFTSERRSPGPRCRGERCLTDHYWRLSPSI